jgi:hypothetical protein
MPHTERDGEPVNVDDGNGAPEERFYTFAGWQVKGRLARRRSMCERNTRIPITGSVRVN